MLIKDLSARSGNAIRSGVQKYQNPTAREGVQVKGRPKLGVFRLQTILPANVMNALLDAENATGAYRTRIAANVLCEWAKRQQANRAHG